MTNSSHYSDCFFTDKEDDVLISAGEIVPFLCDLFNPRSVVDVGCGTGLWLSEFRRRGKNVFGIDGDYVNRELLRIPPDDFLAHDLTRPLPINRQFDLVLCLEVAEHLPPASAFDLVRSLVGLGNIIVFSAAIPGQGGIQHLNEQWPAYWVDLFAKCGCEWKDLIRPTIWLNERILWYYRQNMLVFFRGNSGHASGVQKSIFAVDGKPLPVVHPAMYRGLQLNSDPTNISIGATTRFLGTAIRSAISRTIRRLNRFDSKMLS